LRGKVTLRGLKLPLVLIKDIKAGLGKGETRHPRTRIVPEIYISGYYPQKGSRGGIGGRKLGGKKGATRRETGDGKGDPGGPSLGSPDRAGQGGGGTTAPTSGGQKKKRPTHYPAGGGGRSQRGGQKKESGRLLSKPNTGDPFMDFCWGGKDRGVRL